MKGHTKCVREGEVLHWIRLQRTFNRTLNISVNDFDGKNKSARCTRTLLIPFKAGPTVSESDCSTFHFRFQGHQFRRHILQGQGRTEGHEHCCGRHAVRSREDWRGPVTPGPELRRSNTGGLRNERR